MPRALARTPDIPRSEARSLHIPSQPKPRLPRTLVRAFPPIAVWVPEIPPSFSLSVAGALGRQAPLLS